MIKIDEKHLEDILFEKLCNQEGIASLNEKGLDIYSSDNYKVFRQFNLKEYGIPDIVKIDFRSYEIKVEVIELKISDFNISHLLQLGRYISGLNNILRKSFLRNRYVVTGVLIVAGFDSSNEYTWLDQILSDGIEVYSTEYGLDGLSFNKIFSKGWQKAKTDHSLKNFINPALFKEEYKKAYFQRDRFDFNPDNPFS